MNALKASSSSGGIHPPVRHPLISSQCDYPIANDDDSDALIDDDEISLDDLSIVTDSDQTDSNDKSATDVVDGESNSSYNNEEEADTVKRAYEFLQPYLCSKDRLQPTSTLQQLYSKFQHSKDKQSQQKSVKSWYSCQKRGDKELWWVASLSVPSEVAEDWGFNGAIEIASGYFPISSNQRHMVQSMHDNRDLILELFGVYKVHNGEVWFKTKNAAQKSATLNLLFLMNGDTPSTLNLQEVRNGQSVEAESLPSKQFPQWVDRMYALGFGSGRQASAHSRFKLISIKHHAALSDPKGEILSSTNPSLINCIITYSSNNSETTAVKSGGHFSTQHSLEDLLQRLENELSSTTSACQSQIPACEVLEKEYISKTYDSVVHYEMSVPKWSNSKIEEKAFLYELKFYTTATPSIDDKEPDNIVKEKVPFSDSYGYNNIETTRIGLLTGSDVFEECNEMQDLTAQFTIPLNGAALVSVVLCNRTCIDTSDFTHQISHSFNSDDVLKPLSLMKCFNAILFDNGGKTYGLYPPKNPDELITEMESVNCSELDRTYFFLPLLSNAEEEFVSVSDGQNVAIDWRVVCETVYNVTTPAIWRFNISSKLYFGLVSLLVGALAMELALNSSLSSILPYRLGERDKIYTGQNYNLAECLMSLVFTFRGQLYVFIGLVLIIVAMVDRLMPPKRVPTSTLFNRFIKQPIGFKNKVFVLDKKPNTPLTSLSPLLPAKDMATIPDNVKESFYKRYKSNIEEFTYASYHHRYSKCKVKLRFEHEHLTKASQVLSHEENDFTRTYAQNVNRKIRQNSIVEILASRGCLVPELMMLEPMPRDLLYMVQHCCHFMTALERSHTLEVAARRLKYLQAKTNERLQCEPRPFSPTTLINNVNNATEMNGLRTAAALREEERLESLGDAVLMFLTVINLFASYSNQYEYVLDMFKFEIERHGKNIVLFHGALILGLHRLCYDKTRDVSLWRSVYTPTKPAALPDTTTSNLKRLSNTLESMLGALYLSDLSGAMAVGLLNEMARCFGQTEDVDTSNTGPNWFSSNSTCLSTGYQFNHDLQWTSELIRVKAALQNEPSVLSTLEYGTEKLVNILLKLSGRHDLLSQIKSQDFSQLLIHAALFDDSLDETKEESEPTGLESLAILRDKLFHVGHATLLLSLVEEIYRLHPAATSGDIHFSKVCVLSDDFLAYVLIKSGIHECLFDKDSDATFQFMDCMYDADTLGKEFWAERDGWIVPGGIVEYHQRVLIFNQGIDNTDGPCYAGLAAGRLFGQKGCIPKDITGDLMFSMKVIVGALCLSIGIKDAWVLVRPLFLELLLLSPDETRQTFAYVSDLASKCVKGHH